MGNNQRNELRGIPINLTRISMYIVHATKTEIRIRLSFKVYTPTIIATTNYYYLTTTTSFVSIFSTKLGVTFPIVAQMKHVYQRQGGPRRSLFPLCKL